MAALPRHKMTADEYPGRPGRFELYAGTAYQMAPERTRHAEITLALHITLLALPGMPGPMNGFTHRRLHRR
jgi:hypothetical protein